MKTFYEILGVPPSATVAEIQSACEVQSKRVQQLLSHSDPTTAARARQGLELLKQIRLTLSDPDKRAAYDASVGAGNPVGGLADPQVRSKKATVRPLSLRPAVKPQTRPASDTIQRVDAWVCPQCQAASPLKTRFCQQCGQEIARECPQCGRLVEISAAFCGVCGLNVKEYVPLPDLHTELNPLDDKIKSKSQSHLNEAVTSSSSKKFWYVDDENSPTIIHRI